MAGVQRDLTVRLQDGTIVGYTEVGAPDGHPVLFFHGNPGSRLWVTWPAMRVAAEDLGIRLLGLDLPGVGLSTYRQDSVAEYPQVVRGVADALGLERFAVMGFSCGGKHACACAWALADRVTHAVLVSSPCSVDLPGVMESWGPSDRLLSVAADRVPWMLRLVHAKIGRDFRRGRFSRLVRMMLERAQADKAIFARADFKKIGLEVNAEGYRQGGRGLAHQDTLESRPWGVPLAEISVPIDIWHGMDDRIVPPEQARILAARLPHVTTHFIPGEGHLSMAENQIRPALASASRER